MKGIIQLPCGYINVGVEALVSNDNCLYLTSDSQNKNLNIFLSKHFIQDILHRYNRLNAERHEQYINIQNTATKEALNTYIFSKEHFQTILQIVCCCCCWIFKRLLCL